MNNNRVMQLSLSFMIMAIMMFSFSESSAFAHPHPGTILVEEQHNHDAQTEIMPLDATTGLEKTTVFFHASSYNTLPWGFVEGKIENPVQGHPVIIQIFKDGEAVHFAQTSVNENNQYQYKFRVLNSDSEGQSTKIFDGDYLVKIFKVVYLDQRNQV
ncbi:hypothetical protein [Nitrosopumilus sp.]|uniref:hypothetical protein n=1 Tax=Nitrosopumilus sp. TaxID=2024843 RepID=UPI003B5B2E09